MRLRTILALAPEGMPSPCGEVAALWYFAAVSSPPTDAQSPSSGASSIFTAVLIGGVLLSAAIVFVRSSDEPADGPAAPAPVTPASSADPQSAPATAPKGTHAKQWIQLVETLASLERYQNRAGLSFQELDAAMAKAASAKAPLRSPSPSAAQPRRGVDGAPPPPDDLPQDAIPSGTLPAGVDRIPIGAGSEFVAPEVEAAAQLWNDWRLQYLADLEAAQRQLPDPESIDPKLVEAHAGLLDLLAASGALPEGTPPDPGPRDSWLRELQSKTQAVRASLDAAR